MNGQNPATSNVVDITIALVNYNTGHLLDRLFSAIAAAQGDLKLQTIVIDNASRDDSIELLRGKYPDVELIENTINVGFGRANNQALARMRGRYLLLLNTDAFVAPDTLIKTIRFMEQNPRSGILGVKLVGEDGSLQPSCRFFPTPWNVFLVANGLTKLFPKTRLVDDMAWDHRRTRGCDWVPGCYYLVRKEVIDQVGLFDPRFFLYYEEVDHCRRSHKAGWDVTYYGDTQVVHVGGESARTDAAITRAGSTDRPPSSRKRAFVLSKTLWFVGAARFNPFDGLRRSISDHQGHFRTSEAGERGAEREKLKMIVSLLLPTRWATQSTR